MTGRTYRAGERCGWCITGKHEHCVVVIETGVKNDRGNRTGPKSRHPGRWRCHCEHQGPVLGTHPGSRCVDCQRPGVEVEEDRCKDQAACARYRGEKKRAFKRPPPGNILEEEQDHV